MHTHLLHRSCHCWKHWRKASFGIFWNSAITFDLMSSMFAKCIPLRPIFRVGNSQNSLGVRSREYSGWVMMTGMLFSVRRRVSHPWRTSDQMQWPNSGRFQKKHSAGASNNGRIDGASVCVRARVLL